MCITILYSYYEIIENNTSDNKLHEKRSTDISFRG